VRRRKSKAPPAAPRVLNPLRNCAHCKGYGWVPEVASPAMKRDVPGLSERVEFRPRVVRCSCTIPDRRDQVAAPDPAPAGLDQAQRASGEREEA
jgi:hypothetical protein